VGYTERGPVPDDFPPGFDPSLVALRLTSWAEYQTYFGSFLTNGYLPYSVQAFFANGGDTCYVVRVAATRSSIATDRQAVAANYPLPSGAAQPVGALAGPGGGFTVQITLTPPQTAAALVGALIVVSHSGLTESYTVLAVMPDGSFLLSTALDSRFALGDAVVRYPSAAVVTASSRGAWGNGIQLRFTALDAGGPGDPGAFNLTVSLGAGPGGAPAQQETYSSLVLDPARPNDAAATLAAQSKLIRLTYSGGKIWFDAAGPLGDRVVYLEGGRDGVAEVTLEDFSGSSTDRRGLHLLEEIDEIGLLAIPDAVLTIAPPLPASPPSPLDPCAPVPASAPPVLRADPTGIPAPLSDSDRISLQMLMVEQCERLNFRFAILDTPAPLQLIAMQNWPSEQGLINRSAAFAALYYPWLMVTDPLSTTLKSLPPSGFVAGAYASVDVWKPPANVQLTIAVDVAQDMTDAQQGPLNDSRVNVIRAFPGRGIRIWGARTLAAEDSWEFVNVRRLISAIEDTVLHSSRWAVFQVNNTALRKALTHSLSVLLEAIWRGGGLAGDTAAEAFYVKCDDTNNTQLTIDAGQVICQVGVAAAAPMEFLVFQVRQDASGGTIMES
jgi:uncharacterized protein